MIRKSRFIVYAAFILLPISSSEAQEPEAFLNHISIVLDTATYHRMFEPVFIREKFADCKTDTMRTANDEWTGKYINGLNGYFEFFTVAGYKGAVIGDVGLGFMTTRSNSLANFRKRQAAERDSIWTDTMTFVVSEKKKPRYYLTGLYRKDSTYPLTTWLMENTPEALAKAGFTPAEIKSGVKETDYKLRTSKRSFAKYFKQLTSVTLSVAPEEYAFLDKSLRNYGLEKHGDLFYNDQIQIHIEKSAGKNSRLKEVVAQLTQPLSYQKIVVSDQLYIEIIGNKAKWRFIFDDK